MVSTPNDVGWPAPCEESGLGRRGWQLLRQVRHHPGRISLLVATVVVVGAGGFVANFFLRGFYHLHAAQKAYQQHHLALAQQHLVPCLAAWPRRAEVHLLAAQVARRSGALEDAARHLDECELLQGESSATVRLERILLQAQRGELSPETERYLAAFVERDTPEAAAALECLARSFLEVQRLAAALDCVNRCLRKQPENVPALVLRGRIHEQQSSIEALDDYRRALELEPQHEEARLRLAEALFTFGRADEATAQFELLQTRQPEAPAVRLGLARCRYHAGRLSEARKLLDGLVAEHPHELGALKEQGRLALEEGKGADAERWLRQALQMDLSDRELHHLLGQALRQQGKEQEAQQQQERTNRVLADLTRMGEILNVEMKTKARDPVLLCEVGTLCLRYGKREQGIRWLVRALECDPGYGPARQALAEQAGGGATPDPVSPEGKGPGC